MLKVLAILLMVSDHIGFLFFSPPENFTLRGLGRLCFPTFAYLLASGYQRTKNYSHYLFRIGLLAIVSQYPFHYFLKQLGFKGVFLNIGFSLFLGLLCIKICEYLIQEKEGWKRFSYGILIICLLIISKFSNIDYDISGIALILSFYFFRIKYPDPVKLFISIFIIFNYFFISSTWLLPYTKVIPISHENLLFFNLLASFVISLLCLLVIKVPDTRFRYSQIIFYLFYPLHLLILAWVKQLFY